MTGGQGLDASTSSLARLRLRAMSDLCSDFLASASDGACSFKELLRMSADVRTKRFLRDYK